MMKEYKRCGGKVQVEGPERMGREEQCVHPETMKKGQLQIWFGLDKMAEHKTGLLGNGHRYKKLQ